MQAIAELTPGVAGREVGFDALSLLVRHLDDQAQRSIKALEVTALDLLIKVALRVKAGHRKAEAEHKPADDGLEQVRNPLAQGFDGPSPPCVRSGTGTMRARDEAILDQANSL